mgnify:CR=1 FL=1
MTKSEVQLLHDDIVNLANIMNIKFEQIDKRLDSLESDVS